MTTAPLGARKLDQLDREELLATTRHLLAETQALSSRIAALNEIGVAINRTFDLDEILQVVARQAKWLLDYQHFSACLRQPNGEWKVITLFGKPFTMNSDQLSETKNLGSVLKTAQSRLVQQAEPGMFLDHFASQIIIPLLDHGLVTGTINFATTEPKAYTQDDLRIGYMLALQLASAISNAEHVRQLNEIQLAMQAYNEELIASNQELDAYNHTIAHDLKSPLTSIGLNADMVQRIAKDALPPKAVQYLNNIKASSFKMADMIEQLLWLAKSRNTSELVSTVDTKLPIDAAVNRFQLQLDASSIQVIIGTDLPPVMGHSQWLEEIFANLISNAIKYMGFGKTNPCITIQGYQMGSTVRYEVVDTGVGISKDDQQRLFTMFTRLHTVKAEGLGLGLSIVHRMITRMGGQLGVESLPGTGSTFWFSLPAAETQIEPGDVTGVPSLIAV
ncbi:MAG: HAMP domain-containing histidine kinase [Chloroflexi bacterium]|nr:HAMP domain-containing histidine kinase [Chloroflexota bacterium]MCC6894174.1 HAMP domain-containing histidine kinase [Anaerolineae bacterium]